MICRFVGKQAHLLFIIPEYYLFNLLYIMQLFLRKLSSAVPMCRLQDGAAVSADSWTLAGHQGRLPPFRERGITSNCLVLTLAYSIPLPNK
jgi:hypothetical protein